MKPRCTICNAAMKSPYERVGAKGSWSSINTWWFCSSCNRMEHHPDVQISTDKRQYLDKDVADKYPKIARYRSHGDVPFTDLQELTTEINRFRKRAENFPKYLHSPIAHHQFHDTSKTYSYLEGVWLCSNCLAFKKLEEEEITELEQTDTMQNIPMHCDIPMRLSSVSQDLVKQKFDRTKTSLLINSDDPAIPLEFLKYMLGLLSNHFFRKVVNDFTEISIKVPILQDSFEYNLVHHLLSIFKIYNLPLDFNLISPSELNHLRIGLGSFSVAERQHITTLRLSVFYDLKAMILSLQSLSVREKLVLYKPLWVIETIILAGQSGTPIPDFSPMSIKKKPSLFKSWNEVLNQANE